MSKVLIIDTNPLLLLIVGSADLNYIASHKRIQNLTIDHYNALIEIAGGFDEIVLIPQIVVEVHALAKQIANPARRQVRRALKTFVRQTYEIEARSIVGVDHQRYLDLGVTDCILLNICLEPPAGLDVTLMTLDTMLANELNALGCSVVDFNEYV